MKLTKLLLAGSLLLLLSLNVAGQTFYKDGSVYYFSKEISFNPGLFPFPSFSKDSVILDSVTSEGEFYTIQRHGSFHDYNLSYYIDTFPIFDDNYSYRLRVKDKRVYYTGFINLKGREGLYVDTTLNYDNLLIYDFNLNKNDTLSIEYFEDNIFKSNVLDVKYETYADSVSRKILTIQSRNYSTNKYSFESYLFSGIDTIKEGLGTNNGLLPFEINPVPTNHKGFRDFFRGKMFSACYNDKLIYSKISQSFLSEDLDLNLCDDNAWLNNITKQHSWYIEESNSKPLKLYPNPARDELSIDFMGNSVSIIMLQDIHGKTIYNAPIYNNETSHIMDARHFSQGIYIVRIIGRHGVYTKKVVKE